MLRNLGHVYAIENTYAKQSQHQIKPLSDIQAMMEIDTHAKDHNDGSINTTAHQYHLSEVSTGGFYVVDSYGDEREAGGIEEDVDDRPQIIVHSTEPESHLQHILYRQSYQGSNNHPSRTLIPLVLPSYMQMRECYDEGIDEHEYKTCKLK